MDSESADVRLARIEEGLVHMHGKIDRNHREAMDALKPMSSRVQKHQESLLILKRDRFWIFMISGGALSLAGYALAEIIAKHA